MAYSLTVPLLALTCVHVILSPHPPPVNSRTGEKVGPGFEAFRRVSAILRNVVPCNGVMPPYATLRTHVRR